LRQWAWGTSADVVTSFACRPIAATAGTRRGRVLAIRSTRSPTSARPGCAKIVDRASDRLLGHLGEDVAHDVHPAVSSGGALQHDGVGVGVGQAAVGVADDQRHAAQTAVAQPPQGLRRERRVSLSPTAHPRTSRRPQELTPVAMSTANGGSLICRFVMPLAGFEPATHGLGIRGVEKSGVQRPAPSASKPRHPCSSKAKFGRQRDVAGRGRSRVGPGPVEVLRRYCGPPPRHPATGGGRSPPECRGRPKQRRAAGGAAGVGRGDQVPISMVVIPARVRFRRSRL
jgi:hypothetical protein